MCVLKLSLYLRNRAFPLETSLSITNDIMGWKWKPQGFGSADVHCTKVFVTVASNSDARCLIFILVSPDQLVGTNDNHNENEFVQPVMSIAPINR